MNRSLHPSSRLPCLGPLVVALVAFSPASAQTVPATAVTPAQPAIRATPSPAEIASLGTARSAALGGETPIELSPFEVNADKDRGYAATNTLGGTRLRTDLNDLAASISVVTKELMNDLAADDLTRLANYTMNTEVSGINGNFSGSMDIGFTDFSDIVRQTQAPVRLRGLATASRTRDYFLTDVPEDGYNMDRTEIQRGPNGMLFGLGSPAGVVNAVTSQPGLLRNHTSVGTRFDQYGSYRGSLNHNQVLIKDKLAVRVATLYNRSQYQVEEAFTLTRRGFAAITYKPFRDTTLRVNGEQGLISGSPPQTNPPLDAFSYWWDAGKPVYNAYTNTFSFLGKPPTGFRFNGNANQFLSNAGQSRAANPSLIIEDPSTGVYGLSIPGNPQAAELATNRLYRNATNTGWVNGDHYTTGPSNVYRRIAQSEIGSFADGFWRYPRISDPAIFDFFHHQLDGTSRSFGQKWDILHLNLEQRLGKNAGIELAYYVQDATRRVLDFVNFNRYTLSLDVTSVLADGNPNPNYGRPFMADAAPSRTIFNDRDAFRATAYYDLDTKRFFAPDSLLGKILGRHTFTSNYTAQKNFAMTWGGNAMLERAYYDVIQSQNQGTTSIARITSNGQRQINVLTYLGPSLIGRSGPQGGGITGVAGDYNPSSIRPSSIKFYYHQIPPAASTTPIPYATRSYNAIYPSKWDTSATANFGSKTKDDFRAVTLVGQDRWLENTVVTTWGWRRDWIKTFDAGGVTFDSTGQMYVDDAHWGLKPRLDQKHDAFNYGVVLHAPKFITRILPKGTEFGLTYNHSDNFTPQAARLDVYGRDIPPTTGESKDYGMYLSLLDKKIYLRLSYYDSASAYSTNGGSQILSLDRGWFDAMQNLTQGRTHILADGTDQSAREAAFIAFMRSPEATVFYNDHVAGYHVDANGNLVGTRDGTLDRVQGTSDISAKGWELELTANPTRNWRITANVAKQQPMLSNSLVELAALLDSWAPQLRDGLAGDFVWQGGSSTQTMRTVYNNMVANATKVRALDGSVSPEVRKWRFNVVTNYSFDSGRFKGWGGGTAYRWQEKAAIGYGAKLVSGAGQYDVQKPYYGAAEKNYDGWISYGRRIWHDRVQWKVQLNVRDIGKHHKLILVSALPDGSIDAWRIAGDQSWTLSNSFDF